VIVFFLSSDSAASSLLSLYTVGVQDGAAAKGYTDLFMEEELVPSSSEDDEDSVLED
jgi:hypothetical protein